MDFTSQTLQELEAKRSNLSSKFGIVGLDGFVDTIVNPVDSRYGTGDDFTAIPSIEEFAMRVGAAAGKSTNIEIFPRVQKLGGNGPILANALREAGSKIRYIGALGKPKIHPVFAEFAKQTEAISLAEPGQTTALEFDDGKIMLGQTSSLEEATYQSMIQAIGEGAFFDMVSRTDLVALVNWTMIPKMTDIFNALLDKVLPNLDTSRQRTFFFDLADPEKRSDSDIKSALLTIKKFQSFGRCILGLNFKEAQTVARILGTEPGDRDKSNLKRLCAGIRQELSIHTVVVHPTESAACATKEDSWFVPGPYCQKPRITTGAGDHFNAGFLTGMLMGLSPRACLVSGVATSGFYVRQARSPSLNALDHFIRNWPSS
ncbi:MAG: carbohydrate kinase family protein [Opitutales bacterium]|nr:carbohydrate kinase family protein [Opitutales bacterium]